MAWWNKAEQESEHGKKVDKAASKGSTADKVAANRKRKQAIHNRIQREMNPSRQQNPPQTGPSSQNNDDESYD